jgi:hypothetical protein
VCVDQVERCIAKREFLAVGDEEVGGTFLEREILRGQRN